MCGIPFASASVLSGKRGSCLVNLEMQWPFPHSQEKHLGAKVVTVFPQMSLGVKKPR